MKFLYFYRVPLPDPRADAIQIVNTCGALARAGADVTLHVETVTSASQADCLAYYGCDGPPAGGPGRFELKALGRHWSWPFFDWKTSRLLREAGASAILFVREVRPYVPGLVARARAAGLKVIFEAHNVSAMLVKEKEMKAAQPAGPREFSLLSTEGRTALKLVGEDHGGSHGHEHGDGHDHPEGHGHAGDHDHDLQREASKPAAESLPPNLDQSPAPPPPPASADSPESRDLRRKAEQRAALEGAILKAADGLICTQRATLEGLRHLLRPGVPATLLGNGTRVPASLPDRAKEIDVLYCGSLKPWKGVDTVVAAMQTLFPWKLTIVGPGTAEDVRRLQQAALAVGVLERVRILPPVNPIEVWDLYARAKVGVIPLPGDGYVEARDFTSPLKLFEMMAAGLPVVASRLNSITEYVTDGREALLVPSDDPRPLAAALRKALSDNALRASLSAAARVRAAEYSWENRGRKILAFAQEVIG